MTLLFYFILTPDKVCVIFSHTKRVKENEKVLQLKQFADVLLTGLIF